MKKRYPITTQKFLGERFKDHGLDLDTLPELIAYKNILVETAKELWRAKNPERERLKKNFEDGLKLKFYRIDPGSTAVPIEREYEVADESFDFREPDELDEAVALVDEAILAAEKDRLLPANFPKNVIPLFEELGKTLREGESIEFYPPAERSKVIYTTVVRERLLARGTGEYQDAVTVSGEMRGTQLDGNRFTLRLQDGTNVSGKFQPDQETAITDALRDHASCRVEIQGLGIFDPDGLLKRIETVEQLHIRPTLGESPFDASARPIWEEVAALGEAISSDEWEKLPKDASKHLDHYLYGKAKTSGDKV